LGALDETGAPYNNNPIICTKVSIGFLAIYNTTLAKNMAIYLESNTSPLREGIVRVYLKRGIL
jgi:hypothetical protein